MKESRSRAAKRYDSPWVLTPKRLSEVERTLQAATAAYFCASGYYVATEIELPEGYARRIADVAGIRPIMKELKKRSLRGPAPIGVLSLLDQEEWTAIEAIINQIGGEPGFAQGVLLESEAKGWVEKKVVEEEVYWRLKDYCYPGRESFIARCASTSPPQALEDLKKMADCCQCIHLVLDYEVDTEFMDLCVKGGVGIMVYVPRIGYLREILPAENREVIDRRGFMSLCEKVLFVNYILRRDEWI